MAHALALLSTILLAAAAPKAARPEAPKPPLEATRVEDGGVVFLQLKANQELADIAVRVEPTQRLVEFKAMKAGEIRKVALVGATGVTVAARELEPMRLELNGDASAVAPAKPGKDPKTAKKKQLDRNDIAQVTRSNTKRVRECYERQLAANPKLAGQLRVQWTILPSGAVSNVDIKNSTLESPAVGNCVRALVRTWKFPESSEETSITYPFLFRPQ